MLLKISEASFQIQTETRVWDLGEIIEVVVGCYNVEQCYFEIKLNNCNLRFHFLPGCEFFNYLIAHLHQTIWLWFDGDDVCWSESSYA